MLERFPDYLPGLVDNLCREADNRTFIILHKMAAEATRSTVEIAAQLDITPDIP